MYKFEEKYLEHVSHRLTHYFISKEEGEAYVNEVTQEEMIRFKEGFDVRKQASLQGLKMVLKESRLSHEFIIELHKTLKHMESSVDVGNYKTTENLVNEQKKTAPEHVYEEMDMWIENQNTFLESERNKDQIIAHIAKSHLQFAKIHPFNDGNGSTGRMLNVFLALKKGLLPIVLLAKDSNETNEYIYHMDKQSMSNYMTKILEQEELVYKKLTKVK